MRSRLLKDEARRELIESQLDRCENPDLADVVERNISTILKLRLKEEAQKTTQDRIADAITTFSGDMKFVYLHAILFAGWMLVNTGKFGIHPWDPYPYNLLTMTVSLEAIFLSTFVLVSQNRMGAAADKRADLDLQINLLAEHEITRLLILTNAIATKLGVDTDEKASDLDQLEREVTPDEVLKEIAAREKQSRGEN
jgi:uncharacterized membrane protein